jgi:hypothetical protein
MATQHATNHHVGMLFPLRSLVIFLSVTCRHYSSTVRWSDWVTTVRQDPKEAFEADLLVAFGGLVVIVVGGLVAVAGVHARGSADNAGNPLLGNIIAAGGAVIVLGGLVLAVMNVVVWIGGRRSKSGKRRGDGEGP